MSDPTNPDYERGYEHGFADGVDDAAPGLLEAAKALYAALAMVDDFGTATGQNPDVQNRALR